MKKFASIVVAIVLVLAMSIVPAFAAGESYTITINNTAAGHTYEAYQVFAGRLENGTISDITWGTGVNQEGLMAALVEANIGITAEMTTAAQVAEVLETLADDAANLQKFADVISTKLATAAGTDNAAPYAITGLEAGYYLVKDSNGSLDGDNDAYTRFILEVVDDVAVTPKSDIPSVVKKVQEDSYTADGGFGIGFNDVADYDIGDTVPFEFIGTVPTNYADYETYQYIFHDTMSAGLTFNANSVDVKYADKANTYDIQAENYTVVTEGLADGCTFEVRFANLKAVTGVEAGDKIIVTYNATLNAGADIGLDGNPNEVYLEYSNNPNEGGTDETGETPKDKVVVFTYELDVTKQSAEEPHVKLPDAEFTLSKTVDKITSYAIVTDGKLTRWTTNKAEATTLTSDKNGLFKVAGLDDGTYALTETKAPAGYNLLAAPIALVIGSDHDAAADDVQNFNQNWTDGVAANVLTALTLTVDGAVGTADAATGIVSIIVENSTGSVLPSTGGMGTTIFTVTGIVLMLGAAVIMIARRKATGTAVA